MLGGGGRVHKPWHARCVEADGGNSSGTWRVTRWCAGGRVEVYAWFETYAVCNYGGEGEHGERGQRERDGENTWDGWGGRGRRERLGSFHSPHPHTPLPRHTVYSSYTARCCSLSLTTQHSTSKAASTSPMEYITSHHHHLSQPNARQRTHQGRQARRPGRRPTRTGGRV